MDLKEYQEKAVRTVNTKLSDDAQLANFALGISGEFGEFAVILDALPDNHEKAIDEAGDVFFYVANLATFLGEDWRGWFPKTIRRVTIGTAKDKCYYHASQIGDAVKKKTAQHHELDRDTIIPHVRTFMEYMMSVLFIYYALEPQEICAFNHKKLLKRYPHGFEAEKSKNREV